MQIRIVIFSGQKPPEHHKSKQGGKHQKIENALGICIKVLISIKNRFHQKMASIYGFLVYILKFRVFIKNWHSRYNKPENDDS